MRRPEDLCTEAYDVTDDNCHNDQGACPCLQFKQAQAKRARYHRRFHAFDFVVIVLALLLYPFFRLVAFCREETDLTLHGEFDLDRIEQDEEARIMLDMSSYPLELTTTL